MFPVNKCSGSADAPEPPSAAGIVLTAARRPPKQAEGAARPRSTPSAEAAGERPAPQSSSNGVFIGGKRQSESLCSSDSRRTRT